MKRVPYHNPTTKFVHVGNVLIPPNETREVEAALVSRPGTAAPAVNQDDGPAPTNVVQTLLAGTVDDVRKALADLSAEQLLELAESEEQTAAPRKGVLEAVAAEQLKRASA